MVVSVLYFGVLKDLVGARERAVSLESGATVGELLGLVKVGDARVWGTLAVAVNHEYAGLGTVLRAGDEVALLPPVSGGCGPTHRDEGAMNWVPGFIF